MVLIETIPKRFLEHLAIKQGLWWMVLFGVNLILEMYSNVIPKKIFWNQFRETIPGKQFLETIPISN